MADIRVTVWNENVHEQTNEAIGKLYPKGIHGRIAEVLEAKPGLAVRTATLEQPEHGLTEQVLAETDVLFWWGHCAHGKVEDAIVDRVQQRVLEGMGLVVLHSGHYSKPFKRLMGTNCSLKWREQAERERLWNCAPGHPLTQGIGDFIQLENTEMYGERFDIPEPDQLIFISWFEGGEVFRSGALFNRGNGKVFYFRPGHESYPIYYNDEVMQVLENAARFCAATVTKSTAGAPCIKEPLETLSEKQVDFAKAGISGQK